MKQNKVLSILRKKIIIGRKIKGNSNNKILVSISTSRAIFFQTLAHRFVDPMLEIPDSITQVGA